MILTIVIILILLIVVLPLALMLWLLKNIDFDQNEEQRLCDSYNQAMTPGYKRTASNAGISRAR